MFAQMCEPSPPAMFIKPENFIATDGWSVAPDGSRDGDAASSSDPLENEGSSGMGWVRKRRAAKEKCERESRDAEASSESTAPSSAHVAAVDAASTPSSHTLAHKFRHPHRH
jgi:hypothetical protein